MSDIVERLTKLKGLHDAGVLTAEEFTEAKAALISGATAVTPTAAPVETKPATPEFLSMPPVDTASTDVLSGVTRMPGTAAVDPAEALLGGGTRMATAAPATSTAHSGLSIGSTLIDRYIVTQKLGEGGMGHVYKATDKDTEQDVAVKIISPQLAGAPGMLEGLRKEVATARRLGSHRNLLRILDIHLRESPPFITMEIAGGGDLEEYWLAHSRRLPVTDAKRVIGQVLEGLNALHESRVVHQDIKPQNILLASDSSVRITDYGISRSIKDQVSSGGVDGSGTLAYMAPEQLAGQICDRRADLYSVGIMAHQLVMGRFPFSVTSEAEVERWHREGVREFEGLPSPFDVVIPKLIAIDPEQRFRDAEETLSALRRPPDAPASSMTTVPTGGASSVEETLGVPAVAEQPSICSVVLVDSGPKKIAAIKAVRAITGWGLREAKDGVENPPLTIREGLDSASAKRIQRQLEQTGARVEITGGGTDSVAVATFDEPIFPDEDEAPKALLEQAIAASGWSPGTSTYYGPGKIPSKKLANAIASFGGKTKPSDVRVLNDLTVFGSAKNALLITDERILWKDMNDHSGDIAFEQLRSVREDGGAWVLAYDTELHGVQEWRIKQHIGSVRKGFVALLNAVIELRPESEKPAEDLRPAFMHESTDVSLDDIRSALFTAIEKTKTTEATVSEEKRQKAKQKSLRSFGYGVEESDVLAIWSQANGAQPGLALSNRGIGWAGNGKNPDRSFSFRQIRSVRYKSGLAWDLVYITADREYKLEITGGVLDLYLDDDTRRLVPSRPKFWGQILFDTLDSLVGPR